MKTLLLGLVFAAALIVRPSIAHGFSLADELSRLAADAPLPWQPQGSAEPEAERAERLRTIATAIALESATPPAGWRWGAHELAALLLATSYEEGWRWRRDVHDGTKTGDNGKARCVMQLHRHPTWMPKELWLASTGTDLASTRICVAGAARVLAHYAEACVKDWRARRDIEGSFARVAMGYGTGERCSPAPWAYARARRASRWLGELNK